jgi:hypothetical protein
MFKQHDDDYDEMAADPIRRRAQIASLTKRRPFMFCGVMVVLVCAVVEVWNGEKSAIHEVFAAAIFWGILIKQESDLRLLRVIDWLQKGKDEKPSA